MARVTQKPGRQNAATGNERGGQIAKARKKQKIILESVSKEKNQLRSVLSFRADPPPGYTFIPAGNPELTAALKEFARAGNHKIYSVSTTPHAARHALSREVHRVGFHFPTAVVSQVCAHYGVRLTSGGRLIEDNKNNDRLFMKLYQKGQLVLDEKVQDQVTINTEAKQIIKDLFPNIPDKDMFQIIKTAFQLGDGKVGTADEIPLVRRAQLSVVAHIRHIYTEYDRLLRIVPYNQARHSVEKDTLRKLVEWRGDDDKTDDASRQAVDDLFKEVIVISDEDDSDSDAEDVEQIGHEDLQVEELADHDYNLAVRRPLSPRHINLVDDAPQGYRFAPLVSRRYQLSEDDMVRRQRDRYAVWDQARQDYRTAVVQPAPTYERIVLRDEGNLQQRRPAQQLSIDSSARNQAVEVEQHSSRPIESSSFVRGADGILYERIVVRQANEPQAQVVGHVRRPSPPRDSYSRPQTPRLQNPRQHRHAPSLDGGDGSILPSIEGHAGDYASPRSKQNPFDRPHQAYPVRDIPSPYAQGRAPVNPVTLDSSDDHTLYSKRRRIEEPLHYSQSFHSSTSQPKENFNQRDERIRVLSNLGFPERSVVDLGKHPMSAHIATRRNASGTYEIRDTTDLQPRSFRDARESVYTESQSQIRGYPRAVEHEQPVFERIHVPDDHIRSSRVEGHIFLDSNGSRSIRGDYLAETQGHRIIYTDAPARYPQEAVRSEQVLHETRPLPREYISSPHYERIPVQTLHDSTIHNQYLPARIHESDPRSATKRYDELQHVTYVRN